MEGSCGKILETDDPKVVIKRMPIKSSSHKCILTHRAPMQCKIQIWAHELCRPENGFKVIRVPKAWGYDDREYYMEKIDITKPIKPEDSDLIHDLQLLKEKGIESGYYPCDFELYRQHDGTVALVDFDKFGLWCMEARSWMANRIPISQ